MFGPENMSSSESEEARLIQEFENDPFEKEAQEMGEKWRQELKERYPTPESAARDYREGYWTLQEMAEIFNEEEIEHMMEECRKLEAAGE